MRLLRQILLFLSFALPIEAQLLDRTHTWSSPTKLYVVLVKFRDATALATDPAEVRQRLSNDVPRGWTQNTSGAWVPGRSSYTLDDFKRLFGESGTFDGTGVRVANGSETLPELYGSVKEYFAHVSGGDFVLQPQVVNRAVTVGGVEYPEWIQLPETRVHYEASLRDFWRHCLLATQLEGYTIPDGDTVEERKGNKIAFIYGGPELRSADSLIPRLQSSTSEYYSNQPSQYAWMYLASERRSNAEEGFFHSIGVHAHEIGHFFSLPDHRNSRVFAANPYVPEEDRGRIDSSNITGDWSLMGSATHGPAVWGNRNAAGEAWVAPYGSCPLPMVVAHRKQIGWDDDEVVITETSEDQPIKPGPDKFYRIVSSDFLSNPTNIYLELLTADGFGEYISWHQFDEVPGILMWRESSGPRDGTPTSHRYDDYPRLIPADGRILSDSRSAIARQPISGTLRSGFDKPNLSSAANSFDYTWKDAISDLWGFREGNGFDTDFVLEGHAHRDNVVHADDHQRVLNNHQNPPGDDHPPTRVAIRRVRLTPSATDVKTGEALVNIYTNHWIGDVDENYTARGQVYIGGDLTITDGATLTIAEDAVVASLSPSPWTGMATGVRISSSMMAR